MSRYSTSFLGFNYSRVGYVEQFDFCGAIIYRRCGAIRNLFGFEWVEKD